MDENTVNPSPRFWDRNQLYEEVWSQPLTKIAQRYGVSDVAIAKVCRKLQIPLPGRGYWAKKEHGHLVERIPLPELNDAPRLMKPSPSVEPKVPDCAEDRTQFDEIDRLLAGGAFAVAFDEKMLEHPLVRTAAKILQGGTEDVRHIVFPPGTHACLDIRVSRKNIDRALRIAARLIATLEIHQYKTIVKSETRETAVLCEGEEVRFTIREKVRQLQLQPNSSGKDYSVFTNKRIEYEPTGQLSIDIPEYAELLKKKWTDTENKELEESIPQCIAGILKIAVVLRRRRRDWHERDLARKKREMEVAELLQRIKEEKTRLKELAQMVANWRMAKDIREFIAAMETTKTASSSDTKPESEFHQWIRWARNQADRLDPLTPSPPSVLDQEDQITSGDYSSNAHRTLEDLRAEEMRCEERTRYFWMGWSKGKSNR